jgi:hypothetical protein
MAIRIALFAVPTAAVVGLVLLLNAVDASAGSAVVSLSVVMVISGAAFGYFADRLPEFPGARRRHSQASARLADVHSDRR